MIIPGLRVIAGSITLSCVIVALLAVIFKDSIMQQAPTNYNGLYSVLLLNAVVVNFLLGTFAVAIGAFTIKTNQRNAKGEEIT